MGNMNPHRQLFLRTQESGNGSGGAVAYDVSSNNGEITTCRTSSNEGLDNGEKRNN